jgi:hypothetical protein
MKANQPLSHPHDVDLQADKDTAALDMAKVVFLYVIQLLYLASKNRPNQLVESEMTTTSCPTDWAQAEAVKYGMAMNGSSGTT